MSRSLGRWPVLALVLTAALLTGCGTSTAEGSGESVTSASRVVVSSVDSANAPTEGTMTDPPSTADSIAGTALDGGAAGSPGQSDPEADPGAGAGAGNATNDQTAVTQAPTGAGAGPQGEPPTPDGPAAEPSAVTGGAGEGFSSSVSVIDEALAARMASSWRPGCPVPLADLRYLTVTYRGFDGADHTGELVVASSVTADVATIFEKLYDAGYPIQSLRLVDDFGGSDDDSMAANNSSAFNCRPVTGGGGFSEHSYGTAIDLNPVQNPYVSGSSVLPEAGRAHADRSPGPGVIQPGDAVVAAFAASGWSWGGSWTSPVDYQHFSVSGR